MAEITKSQCEELLGKPLNWGERRLVEKALDSIINPACFHCGRGTSFDSEEAVSFVRTAHGYGVNVTQ